MIYLVSSKRIFNIKKRNYYSIYTENFELFCLLKNHDSKRFIFNAYLYKKSKNSDQIINFFFKKWYLDNNNIDIFDLDVEFQFLKLLIEE